MTEENKNTVLWVFLIILIIMGGYISKNHLNYALIFIPIVSIIKFLSIGFQFMETKVAHKFWQILLIIFCLIYIVGIGIFY